MTDTRKNIERNRAAFVVARKQRRPMECPAVRIGDRVVSRAGWSGTAIARMPVKHDGWKVEWDDACVAGKPFARKISRVSPVELEFEDGHR